MLFLLNNHFPYTLYRICGISFDIWQKYRLSYDSLEQLRVALQNDILHPNITFSLPYSSLLFAEKVTEWAAKNPAHFRKRERQTERAALKYLTRASAKTSPFAGFTTLQITENQFIKNFNLNNNKNLNIKILDIVCDLLPQIKAVRNQLFVTINDTCFCENENVFFIQNKENKETLQVLEKDDIVSFFLAFFEQNKTIKFVDLCDYLEDENAETFLLQLLEIGFLSFKMPFIKHFEAFSIVTKLLNEIKNDVLETEKDIFDKLMIICETPTEASIFDEFTLRKEEIYYEDVCSNHIELYNYNEALSGLYNNVGTIFSTLQKIVYCLYINELHQKIANVLAENEKKELTITELYKSVFHNASTLAQNYFIPKDKEQKLIDFFEKKIPQNDTFDIHISKKILEDIANFVTQIFQEKDDLCSPSANLILQPYVQNGNFKAVLNGASIGFGKQFARFLPIFDEKITQDFKNENTNSPFLLAELNDASFFNGNQHPHLLDFGISTPNTLHFSEQNIEANNLIIKQLNGKWILFDNEKNTRVIPLDLGIEHPAFRSPYYQLLYFFGYKIANFRIFNDYINYQYPKHKKPRITIDNQLVIQRMTWFFTVEDLPFLQKNQSEKDYFLTVQKWQKTHDLPHLVYVSIPHFQPQTDKINQDAAPQGDDYKPQMIDFQNPLLVTLFARIIKKVPSQLIVEEMLPAEEQIFSFDGQKYMMEAVIQTKSEK